jgi:hypothetical protein
MFLMQGEKEELQAALEEAESALEQEENKVFFLVLSFFFFSFSLLSSFPYSISLSHPSS